VFWKLYLYLLLAFMDPQRSYFTLEIRYYFSTVTFCFQFRIVPLNPRGGGGDAH